MKWLRVELENIYIMISEGYKLRLVVNSKYGGKRVMPRCYVYVFKGIGLW